MRGRNSIITIGLSPAWDITCRGRNIDWGLHKEIDEQTTRPAGKALNVSKALAWMGQRNIAAGLWGDSDYQQMLAVVKNLWPLIRIKLTAVDGCTRQNITVVDSARNKEMHLRNKKTLVSAGALRKLRTDLEKIVHKGSVCVFAGTMPDGGLLSDVIRIVEFCKSRRAKIVLDTSGRALREIIDSGSVRLIKPNVEELREMLGEQIKDSPVSLAKAGRKLLDKVDIVLISRGAKGAVAVTKYGAWQGRCTGRAEVCSTVGCGDFLLAGFMKVFNEGPGTGSALEKAIKVATARAWGWTEETSCRGHSFDPAQDRLARKSRAGRPRHYQSRIQVQIKRV